MTKVSAQFFAFSTVVYKGVINLFRALCSYRDRSLRNGLL